MTRSNMGKPRKFRSALLLGAAVSAIAGGAWAQAATHNFNIPAEAAGEALNAFGRQSGLRILFPYDAVAGKRTAAVVGVMSDDAALARLLTDTGLVVVSRGSGVVTLAPRPQPAAAPAAAEPALPANLSELVVTGTHISGAGPSSSPVRVIGEAEIRNSGRTSVEQLLRTLPENSGGGVGHETFNVVGAGADVTQQGAGVNLRGLGQRATLVLVNGSRLAPSGDGSFVDISLIPLSAVERIEVLTDGASAIYGSDAVGGVVNIILKQSYDGAETSLLAGGSTHGDQGLFQGSQTFGRRWDGGHALISYDYRDLQPGYSQKHDVSTGLHPGVVLFPQEKRQSVTGSISQLFGDGFSADLTGLYSKTNTVRDFYQGGVNLVSARGDAEAKALAGGLGYQLSRSWRIKASFDYSENSSNTSQLTNGGATVTNNYQSRNRLEEAGLSGDGDLFSLPGGPVKLALGAQTRRDSFFTSFITATQINAGLPGTLTSRSRRIVSGYAETEIPIFSALNAIPGFQRLTLNAAYRYERYSDFGSTSNPKFGVLWEPVTGLRLRASYDTSFRAPLLSEVGGVYNAFWLPGANLAVPGTTASGPALVLLGANPALQPERSKTATFGVEYRPEWLKGGEAIFNYFNTRYSNRIAIPSQTTAVLGDPAFAQIVTVGPSVAVVSNFLNSAGIKLDFSGPGFTAGNATPATTAYLIDDRINNNAITTTSGLDAQLRYRGAAGDLGYAASIEGTYLIDFDNKVVPSAPSATLLNIYLEPARLKVRSSLELERGSWLGNIALNYVNAYKDVRFAPARTIRAFTTVDLSLEYDVPGSTAGVLHGMRAQFSVINLFDQNPPFVSLAPGSVSGITYDPVNATGTGRTLSLRITKSW